jgi:predicted nucleic acid-binding protein
MITKQPGASVSGLLVDTCIWVDYLRDLSKPHVEELDRLLALGEVFTCEATVAEICFGARDHKQLLEYQTYFGLLPFLSTPKDWPLRVGEMGFKVRKSGQQPFLADLLIAYTALHFDVPLFTRDHDFDIFKKLFGLKLVS